MIGCAGVFRDRFVPLCWNHPCIGVVLIRLARRLRAVRLRQVRPQLFRAVTAAIADVKGNDLTRLLVHGDPDPLPIGLLLHETPHFVGFRLKTSYDHIIRGDNGLPIQMIGQCSKAGNHEVHEPADTDTNGATDAVQRDFLAESACH